jgi:Zn-dependent peptidase ImmA (M78 family)
LRKIEKEPTGVSMRLRIDERDCMRRLPKTVKVGGHTISVEQVKNLDSMGEYHRGKSTIYINKEISYQQKAATLLHEILHVILGEQVPDMKMEKEEPLVTALEVGLFAFIKDNPKVVRYLEGA